MKGNFKMNNQEIENLINGTNFTDEIEHNLFLMQMSEHDQEIEAQAAKGWQKPDWIDIARGFKEAPEAVKVQAKEIHRQFLRFKPEKDVRSFEELVKLFTLAKINNKINTGDRV